MNSERESLGLVFLTGATGYVGGRLAPWLLERGYSLRCWVRSKKKLLDRPWAGNPSVEIIEGDIEDIDKLSRAMAGCQAAYYLIHSMQVAGKDYAEQDRRLASSFVQAAEKANVGRILYLGGLGELGEDLSEHLSSRREVERVLQSGTVPVTIFRAAMIIGSGSASFEILRYLTERLPVMVTPRWVSTRSQPIAVRNVLCYLAEALEVPQTEGQVLDIGGPEVMTYRELMQLLAEVLGIPERIIIPVPVLTPRLSSMWIHLVTPVSYRLARPLAEGLRNEVVCRDDRVKQLIPQRLIPIREAYERALGRMKAGQVMTAWSDAGVLPGDPDWAGGTAFTDRRTVGIRASVEEVFQAVCKVGGGHGYYAADWLWRIRGWMDVLAGGPGLRRGRKHPEKLQLGDALDFWRIIDIDRPRSLRLRAEMKLPGEALLQFELEEKSPGEVTFVQTARFLPRGLVGLAYWYAVLPLHGVVFSGMLRGIKREGEKSNQH